jgi:hypothetical protein
MRAAIAAATHFVVALLLLAPDPARGQDQPIGADLLRLHARGDGTRLLFESRDPTAPFPAFGGIDDPTGVPGGMRIEVFTPTASPVTIDVPADLGNPGWRAVDGEVDRYTFTNREAPEGPSLARRIDLRRGRLLRVKMAGLALPLGGHLGSALVRITFRGLRTCTLFAGGSVRRDSAGRFLGRDAAAAALPDCTDGTVWGALGFTCAGDFTCNDGSCPPNGTCAPTFDGSCRCVFASQPCSDTTPVCGGECPQDMECVSEPSGIPFVTNCTCVPIGETLCGGSAIPACGGWCPPGLSCLPSGNPWSPGCSCFTPGPCGGGGGECPAGAVCTLLPGGGGPSCWPIFCSSDFPGCGGACPTGLECRPLRVGALDACACTPADAPCDSSCGGHSCPGGQVCNVSAGNCSCEAP